MTRLAAAPADLPMRGRGDLTCGTDSLAMRQGADCPAMLDTAAPVR